MCVTTIDYTKGKMKVCISRCCSPSGTVADQNWDMSGLRKSCCW